MKKILFSAFAAAASVAAFAGMNNVFISFSTQGPDTYSDGTEVGAGEKYAVVWTPEGKEFAGINADGEAAGDSKVVLKVATKVNGRCERVEFQVDEDVVNSMYSNGTWRVVMFDTRVFEFDGDSGNILIVNGKRVVKSVGGSNPVVGYGEVGSPTITKGDFGMVGGLSAVSSTAAADAPAPKVEKIYFEGDNVYVEVSLAKPAFKYDLMSGNSPDVVAEKSDSKYGTATETVTFVKPKRDGGEFFQVNCKYE